MDFRHASFIGIKLGMYFLSKNLKKKKHEF